jgi:hypothetical protein
MKMANLDGTWIYQSYCPQSATKDTKSQIAAPWSPRGELHVTTDLAGKVTGVLKFGPKVELAISGSITSAAGELPEGVELTGEGLGSVNKIRGYFVPGTTGPASGPMIVGTVVAVANDLKGKPIGTQGPFVLFPAVG